MLSISCVIISSETEIPENNDTLIASWKCTTTAGFGNDASCQGKLNIIQGYGEFSGVVGFGNEEW